MLGPVASLEASGMLYFDMDDINKVHAIHGCVFRTKTLHL